jgi:SAM-dependent methyltransferase
MTEGAELDTGRAALLRLVPRDAGLVVEVGCGTGELAALYRRSNPHAQYLGVERHLPAIEQAARQLDRVVYGDAELVTPGQFGIAPETVDCLIYDELLEHVADPWGLVRDQAAWLRPDGVVLARVGNVQHWSVLAGLLCGRWGYRPAEQHPRAHVRFFTRATAVDLFASAGLVVEDVVPLPAPDEAAGRFVELLRPALAALGVDWEEFAEQAAAAHYLVRARRARERARRLLIQTAIGEELVCARVRVHEPNLFLGSIPGVRTVTDSGKVGLVEGPPEEEKVLVWQRCFWQYPRDLAFHQELIRRGYLIVGEWDDDPRTWPATRANQFLHLRACHALQASTGPLADLLRQFNPNVAVFPNQLAELLPLPERTGGPVRLFFAALNREGDWLPILPGLNRVLAEEAGRLSVHVIHDRALFDALQTSAKTFEPFCPYERYVQALRGCDVALLPLEPTDFNRMKSDLKFLECAACGVAGLASPTVYESSLADGATGLIYRGPEEFVDRLRLLVHDEQLRRRLTANAYAWARRERLLAQHFRRRYDWYLSLRDELPRLNDELRERAPELFAGSD